MQLTYRTARDNISKLVESDEAVSYTFIQMMLFLFETLYKPSL